MKGHNIAVYIIIPLALFSIISLFDNVQAQTNSSSANQTTSQQQQQNQNTAQTNSSSANQTTSQQQQQNQNTAQTNSSSANQTTSQQQQQNQNTAQTNSSSANQTTSQQQQQNQNANLTAQALMKTDIVALKNTLMNAQLAIVDGNIEQALKDVMDLETQLILLKPSPPTKFLNNIHKAIAAIATSEIDKSLNTITNIQVSILKAENLIFKAAVANPQVMQQFHTLNYVVPTPQPEKIQQVDISKNVGPTPQPQVMQQFETLETNTIADDFTNIEDS